MKKSLSFMVVAVFATVVVWPIKGSNVTPRNKPELDRGVQEEIQYEGSHEKKGTLIDCYQSGGTC
jgi:hypothetical protein